MKNTTWASIWVLLEKYDKENLKKNNRVMESLIDNNQVSEIGFDPGTHGLWVILIWNRISHKSHI